MRLSIYNLIKPQINKTVALDDFIIQNYKDVPIEEKHLKKKEIGGYKKAKMYYQQFTRPFPEWIENTNELLHEPFEDYEINRDDTRAVIIIQIDKHYFALSFNHGISMVKADFINYDFGFRIARKLLNKEKISGYYSTDISERIINTNKNSANFIPTHLINDRRKLSAVNSISGGGSGRINTKITGRYNLVVNFNKNLKAHLIPYLREISKLYFDDKSEGISITTGISEINDPLEIEHLNNSLVQDIISWTDYLLENNTLPSSFSSKPISFNINQPVLDSSIVYIIEGLGLGSDHVINDDEFTSNFFFQRFCYYIGQNNQNLNIEFILNKLKRDSIYLISGNEKTKVDNIYNSLITRYSLLEKDSDNDAVLISGKWFYISKNHYVKLEKTIDSFKDLYQNIKLPGYSVHDKSELAYNNRVAKQHELYVFDEVWYTYPQHIKDNNFNTSSRIEPCDLLQYTEETKSTERELVLFHIKRGGNAQGISHLTTQAETSANILFDNTGRTDLIDFMNGKFDALNIPEDIKPEEITIVLGITQKRFRVDLRNSLTLLQLDALSRSLTNIKAKGFNVSLNIIPDHSKS